MVIKHCSLLPLVLLLTACTLTPEPMSIKERYSEATNNVKQLFAYHKPKQRKLDYYHALALGLKNNLDYRIKLANNALQADQLTLATFAMYPALNTSASLYTRNNDLASFGTTTTGQVTDVLNSTPRTLRSVRIGMSWNILDFGVSYVRAKQQGDRYLIAMEESRKQLQQLSQDILRAYWEAYSAQKLINDTKQFQVLLAQANSKLTSALSDNSLPKENLLRYQETMLDGNRHLVQLQYKYDKAMLDLKHLLNLPINDHFVLLPPPQALTRVQNLKNLNFAKLDAITLVSRPELQGQNYQKRIAKWGIRAAVIQALPGITLSPGWNYNSNKFLVNNLWIDKSVDVAWNLLNLASLPAALDSAEAQVQYEKLKQMALTLTVLTETRYAYSHYENLTTEYFIAKKQTANADALYQLTFDRSQASLASHQQAILAKLHAITAKMDEYLLLSDLSTSLGELYLSSGFDVLPLDACNQPLPVIVQQIKSRFDAQQTMDFKAYVDNTYKRLFTSSKNVAKK